MRKMGIIGGLLLVALGAQDTLYDESFDPATLNEQQPDWPLIIDPVVSDTALLDQIISQDGGNRQRDGYRVQVLMTPKAAQADSLRMILREQIPDSVYIDFEVPNYKVRAGDFIGRREAEQLQQKLKVLGYRSAWIVRTRIELSADRF